MTDFETAVNKAMLMLAAQSNSIFVGQNVLFSGSAMYKHLDGIPENKRLEFPVAEELQLGFCVGLALQGFLPISIYPRFDFLLLAMNQLVNHLDKLEFMSCGQFKPKVIIRTRVGSRSPLNAGPQHTQDHTEALLHMLTNINVFKITNPDEIMVAYSKAMTLPQSALVIEALGC